MVYLKSVLATYMNETRKGQQQYEATLGWNKRIESKGINRKDGKWADIAMEGCMGKIKWW